MGYYSRVTGTLTVTPSVAQKVIDDLELGPNYDTEFCAEKGGADDTVGLVTDPATGAQTIGVIAGKSWTEIKPRWDEEPYKAYATGEALDVILKRLIREGHQVEGSIYLDGEDGEVSRYRIDGKTLVEEAPELLWPNGDKGRP